MFQLPTALKKVSLPESCCNLVCNLPSVSLKAPPENPIHPFFSTFQISPECHSLLNSNPEPWGKGSSKISFFVSPLQCRDLWRLWKNLEGIAVMPYWQWPCQVFLLDKSNYSNFESKLGDDKHIYRRVITSEQGDSQSQSTARLSL